MADIKDLGVFGANKGLEKIKNKSRKKEETKLTIKETPAKEKKSIKSKEKRTSDTTKKKRANPKGAGAPVRKFDKSLSTKNPIKISPMLDIITRIMVSKYTANVTKDELLRMALNEYIKQNLTQEDKQDLLNSVSKELDLFREKNPTIPELDENGDILQTVEEIEENTRNYLRKDWGMNVKNNNSKR